MKDLLILGLGLWAALATILAVGFAFWVRKDGETIAEQYDKLDEQARELASWRAEAAEINDESMLARFDRSMATLCSALDERTANRIAVALHREDLLREHVGSAKEGSACDELMDEVSALVLRELQNAWKPDPAGEVVA